MSGQLSIVLHWFFSWCQVNKLLLLCILLVAPPVLFAADGVNDKKILVKYGILESNETWSDSVYIVGDVTIPEEYTVVVEPGTTIYYANYDILNGGDDAKVSEIIVKGRFNVESTPDNPVWVKSIDENTPQILDVTDEDVVIEFRPYEIETQGLKEEFRKFKQQYLVFWSVVYAMWILAL